MNETDSGLISAYNAEYSSLRYEINTFHSIEHQTLSINVALVAALIGITATATTSANWPAISGKFWEVLLLGVPIPVVLLGFFFGYSQLRIIQAAVYLNKWLRPNLVALLAHDDVLWQWEYFRRRKQEQQSCDCPARWLAEPIGWFRWVLFIWPGPFALGVLLYPAAVELPGWGLTRCRLQVFAGVEFILYICLVAFAIYCQVLLRKVLPED